MKKKTRAKTFAKKIQIERNAPKTPVTASGRNGSGCHPPRNKITITDDPIIICAYSATKKSPNLKLLYSVWKPPTSSCSDSGMSNGSRSEEHTSELQSRGHLVCRLLLETKK